MRIAYITSVYARASDTFIRNEVIELRRRDHAVSTFSIRRATEDVAVGDEVRAEQAGTDYIVERGGARIALALLKTAARRPGRLAQVLRLASRTRPPGWRAALLHAVYVAEAAYLAERLQALGIEVLHNHIAENSATVAMYASALSGVPFSMTVHGPGIFFHPEHWALGEKIARAAFTVCITEFCKSQCMLFSDIAHWTGLHIVRCAVGRDFENRVPAPIPAAPRLVFVGRLCAEKGLPLLVEAVARVVEAGRPCELVLVGDGPLRGHVEREIERRHLQESIRILGWKDSAGVREQIERSRALVLPSFAEGLPVVCMEALALGRPVISTRIAGIPELIEPGKTGWLVAPGSIEELVTAITEAVDATPEALQAMGDEGVARVRARHGLDTEVSKLEALLAGVTQGRGPVNPSSAARPGSAAPSPVQAAPSR